MVRRLDNSAAQAHHLVDLLPRLELTIGQVAHLTDLTVRQISYWTNKGFLAATNPKKRLYDFKALRKAILMREALTHGYALAEAASLAEQTFALEQANERALREMSPQELEPYVRAKIEELEELCRRVKRALPAAQSGEDLRRSYQLIARLELLSLFERNPGARDTAQWLARQVGRDVTVIEEVLERLVQERYIQRIERGARVIYQRPQTLAPSKERP